MNNFEYQIIDRKNLRLNNRRPRFALGMGFVQQMQCTFARIGSSVVTRRTGGSAG